MADTKLSMSWQCALAAKKANGIPDCIRQGIVSWAREKILLLCSALVRSRLECHVQCWAPQYKRRRPPGESLMKGHEDDWRTEAPRMWGKAERAGTVQPAEETAQGDPTDVYEGLKGGCKEDRARLCSVVPRDRTRNNGHKLKHRTFPLNMRKHFFTVRVIKHWHRSPREMVESPSLSIFKSHLAMGWGNQLGWPCLSLGWGLNRWPSEVSSSLNHSVIPWMRKLLPGSCRDLRGSPIIACHLKTHHRALAWEAALTVQFNKWSTSLANLHFSKKFWFFFITRAREQGDWMHYERVQRMNVYSPKPGRIAKTPNIHC